jgi:hypothetical protein
MWVELHTSVSRLAFRITDLTAEFLTGGKVLAEVPKPWVAHQCRVAVCPHEGEGACCLYEGHIYFERNMGTK